MYNYLPSELWMLVGLIMFIGCLFESMKNDKIYNVQQKLGFLLLSVSGACLFIKEIGLLKENFMFLMMSVFLILGIFLVFYGVYIKDHKIKAKTKKDLKVIAIYFFILILIRILKLQ